MEFPQVSSRPPRFFLPSLAVLALPIPHLSSIMVANRGSPPSRYSSVDLLFLLYLSHLSSSAPLFLSYALPTHLSRVATPAFPLPAFPACLRGWLLAAPADVLATAVIFITLEPSSEPPSVDSGDLTITTATIIHDWCTVVFPVYLYA